MSDRESVLRSLVECPICYEVPQQKKIFQCNNGHIICESCYRLLPAAKKCPQGECPYSVPPTRNLQTEKLIESSTFDLLAG